MKQRPHCVLQSDSMWPREVSSFNRKPIHTWSYCYISPLQLAFWFAFLQFPSDSCPSLRAPASTPWMVWDKWKSATSLSGVKPPYSFWDDPVHSGTANLEISGIWNLDGPGILSYTRSGHSGGREIIRNDLALAWPTLLPRCLFIR